MKKYQLQFNQLKEGAVFYKNGYTYIKVSTRTAHLLEYNKRFYFKKIELVNVTNLFYKNGI